MGLSGPTFSKEGKSALPSKGLREAFADPHSLKKEKMSVNESEKSLVSVLFPIVATFGFLLLKRGSAKAPRMPSKLVHFFL